MCKFNTKPNQPRIKRPQKLQKDASRRIVAKNRGSGGDWGRSTDLSRNWGPRGRSKALQIVKQAQAGRQHSPRHTQISLEISGGRGGGRKLRIHCIGGLRPLFDGGGDEWPIPCKIYPDSTNSILPTTFTQPCLPFSVLDKFHPVLVLILPVATCTLSVQ